CPPLHPYRPGLTRRCSILYPPSPLLWPVTIIMEMDFPLPGLLCEAYLVRHITIAAAQAFVLFLLLVAGRLYVTIVLVAVVMVAVDLVQLRAAEIVQNAP
ncbi:hypothetical protein K440DRAFT_619906, partial [Wilcoxina mikolae CBS 423.85]